MKKFRLALIVIAAMAMMLATVSMASAVTLTLPNGNTVEGLPDGAANAPIADTGPTCPPDCSL